MSDFDFGINLAAGAGVAIAFMSNPLYGAVATAAASKLTKSKYPPNYLTREDLYAIQSEINEGLNKKELSDAEAGECSLEKTYLSSDISKPLSQGNDSIAAIDITTKAIAGRIVRKYSGFYKLNEESKKQFVSTVATAIKAHFNASQAKTLYDLMGKLDSLSYRSFCNTRDAWWTPTLGQLPTAIELLNSDEFNKKIMPIINQYIKPTNGQIIPPPPPPPAPTGTTGPTGVVPPEVQAEPEINPTAQVRPETVTEGRKVQLRITGKNLPKNPTVTGPDFLKNIKITQASSSQMYLEATAGKASDTPLKGNIVLGYGQDKKLSASVELTINKRRRIDIDVDKDKDKDKDKTKKPDPCAGRSGLMLAACCKIHPSAPSCKK